MLRKVMIGVAAALLLLVIVIALQPGTFEIKRSITIAAPAETVFAQVDDFRAWRAWSPWEKLDPAMKRSYEGAARGAGARYAWAGNDEVGEGRMTIERSEAPSKLGVKLEFLEPFAATNQVTFDFEPASSNTKVTWSMAGECDFMSKAFHLFMDVDEMVGADFERGLSALKSAAETAARASARTSNAAK